MMDNTNSKIGPSWGVVIIVIILFWPIGFYLLFKKLLGDKSAVMHNSKVIGVIGYIMAFLGFVYVIMGITGESIEGTAETRTTAIVFGVFFVIGGIVLIRKGRKMRVVAEKYKQYIPIVINGNVTAVENIAAAVPVSYDEAVMDLQKMIDIGVFKSAYIDNSTHEIVLPKVNICNPEQNLHESGEEQIVLCSCCGAQNRVIPGRVSECEYCGSPLK